MRWKHYQTVYPPPPPQKKRKQEREPQVGRGLFGISLLILLFKFQFSKSIKSSIFHIFLKMPKKTAKQPNSGYGYKQNSGYGYKHKDLET